MFTNKYRHTAIGKFIIGLATTALIAFGCAPSQYECNPFNIGLTQLKDQAFVGTIPEVDEALHDFLYKPGDPSPGVAVGIIKDNQILYLKGDGYADLGLVNVPNDEIPFTKETMSRLGSISKTITAVGVLQLANSGHLNLDDLIDAHLPGVPAAWSGMTIRDLLTHQTGLPWDPTQINDPEGWMNLTYPWAAPHPGIHPRLSYYTYLSTPIAYPGLNPGHAKYSNVGYGILGAVIDTITTQPGWTGKSGYEDFLWWNVGLRGGTLADPSMASMCVDTYWRHDTIKDIAKGYRLDKSKQLEPAPVAQRSGWEIPAGGWDMTIGDLTRLALAIQTNQLLNAPATLEMTSEQSVSIDADLGKYGEGVFVGSVLDKPVYSHGGNIDGYTARFTVWPEEGFAIALLTNRSGAKLTDLEEEIAAMFLEPAVGEKLAQAPRVQMTRSDLLKMNTPEYIVSTQHRAKLTNLAQTYFHQGGGPNSAFSALMVKLKAVDPQHRLVQALMRGDYKTAAAVYLEIYPRFPELH